MGTQVFGVKIILQDKAAPVAENTNIGLYNVAGDNSEFRWVQNAVSGVTAWKDGIIVEKGLKSFLIEIDLRRGGSTSLPGSGGVTVKNNDKLWQTVKALGIDFVGLRAEIYIFQGTSPLKLRTYGCEEPTWDGREYTIPFKGRQEAKIAQMLNVVTSRQFQHASKDTLGKVIPMTIGKNYPVFDDNGVMTRSTIAKFIRTEDREYRDIYTNAYFTEEAQNPEIIVFPVVNLIDDTQLVLEVNGTSKAIDIYPSDTYVIIIEGTDSSGQIRRVTKISGTGVTALLAVFVDTVFLNDPESTDDDNRAWAMVVKIHRNYAADHFPCKDFISQNTAATVSYPELYAYSDDEKKFNRIADFGFSISDTAKNKVSVAGGQYENDIDNLKSFAILPITSLALEDAITLDKWGYGPFTTYGPLVKKTDGLYGNSDFIDYATITNGTLNDASDAYDKDSTTYAQFSPTYNGAAHSGYLFYKVLKFGLPILPKNISISKIYFGIKLSSQCDVSYPYVGTGLVGEASIALMFRRFAYSKTTDFIIDDKKTYPDEAGSGINLDDLPDFYYSDSPSSGCLNFYKAVEPDEVGSDKLSGYTLYELPYDLLTYPIILEGGIVFSRFTPDAMTDVLDDTKIYEMAIILELSDETIKDRLFIPLAGRNFAATWDGRKTPADLIEKPADILEHFCRLQNWQDRCDVPVSGWGLQYASGVLIATTDYGSFDAILDRDLYAAGQLLEEDDGYTDKAKQTLCRNFGLANWQDANGYERAIALPTMTQAPIFTVTLDNIMDRKRIKVYEPRQADIFAEPYVRYEKNPATGEYERQITVKNATAGAYSASFVDGVQNAGEAQDLWQTCHSLALKSHQIVKPPTDLTDLTWANGTGGYSIALSHIQRWVRWQSNTEIEFPLHVNDCLSWQECSPINICFSHQTNNVVRAGLVETIEIEPNNPYEAMIKAILYV